MCVVRDVLQLLVSFSVAIASLARSNDALTAETETCSLFMKMFFSILERILII